MSNGRPVRNAAATLIESGNMLTIDARVRDRKDWLSGARGLIKTRERRAQKRRKRKIRTPCSPQAERSTRCAEAATNCMRRTSTHRYRGMT
jgi:hypothetical protein